MNNETHPNRLTNLDTINHFVYAGKARFTLKSTKTGMRYTYRINRKDENGPWFVSVLTGSDNESDYSYAGVVFADTPDKVRQGRKGMSPSAPSMVALGWFLRCLATGNEAIRGVEFWHEGACGRCARTLTDPESIERGIGPVCVEYMAA